jgi:hypothetical protein
MKLDTSELSFNTPIEKNYNKLNNNTLNSLQTYNTVQNYKILHKVIHSFFQHNLKILHHNHI